MHNNYYFLRQLTAQLESSVRGFHIVSCFSQNKDELVIEFNNEIQSFFLKASLSSAFSCLSFPESFNRARKNSIDLFREVILKKITGVRQFQNERSFALLLEGDLQMIFKMHGSRSNVLLIENGSVKELFRNHQKADLQLNPSELDRTIDWSRESFLSHLPNLSKLYFTFGKEVWAYLNEKGFEDGDIDEKWKMIQQVIQQLHQPEFYILEKENGLHFSLLPSGKIIKQFSSPLVAINDFFTRYSIDRGFHSEKNTLLKQLNDQLSASLNYVSKNSQKLIELENDRHYQAWGDLIMANLHRIKAGDKNVIAENFYNHNEPVEIKLREDLSPQKNAETYYRKGKNQQIEIQKLRETVAQKEKEIERITKTISTLESAEVLKDVRKKAGEAGLNANDEKKTPPLPYHEFEFKGYKIWVGRNAEKNDELTLKYTYKEDLWLHAKDVPGSHVIIKHQAGKNFPKDVIERAAELAAYNSKRKTDSLCPVAFTPKKFVRKRKGDPAGAVVVEREQVIMVKPKLEAGDRIS